MHEVTRMANLVSVNSVYTRLNLLSIVYSIPARESSGGIRQRNDTLAKK